MVEDYLHDSLLVERAEGSSGAGAAAADVPAASPGTTDSSKSNMRWRKVQEEVVTQPTNLQLWPSMRELQFATKSGTNAQQFFKRIAAMSTSKSVV
jgi:hypothetical protein